MSFTTGPVPYSNHFGQPDRQLTLQEYVDAMADGGTDTTVSGGDNAKGVKFYVFEDPQHQTLAGGGTRRSAGEGEIGGLVDALRAEYDWRPHFLRYRGGDGNWGGSRAEAMHPIERNLFPIAQQFFVGPAGTGAPIHWHGDAWNVCAHGARKWFLFPPPSASYSNIPMAQWIKDEYVACVYQLLLLSCLLSILTCKSTVYASPYPPPPVIHTSSYTGIPP
jgi:hypothetical protein